ncbi:hypothetical protein GTA08_BOTSDO04993 [Neofusicoccum parvum]|nr:hypothetical protein GTA08_BOTSDO04993 [Neofusicoccum parvum]
MTRWFSEGIGVCKTRGTSFPETSESDNKKQGLRKLKCSGHRPACDRCARENLLPCVYSPQKQMGRPRKRRRGDENGVVNEVVGQNGGNHGVGTPLAHGLSSQSYVSPPAGLSCACLSTIYLTLSSLHSLSSYDFPFVLPPLRSAIVTANTVLDCPHCPLACATAAQNIHGLISLLMTLADAVVRLLAAIDAEAARVDAAGAKKQFMLADASAPLHMHTGTEDCPVRFGMELTGAEWRELARKVVKSQIIGSAAESEAGGCEGTVYGTLAAFLRRQNRWHDDPEMIEVRRQAIGSDPFEKMEGMSKMRLCVQNVEHVKMRMKLLDI